ncbi:DUF6221 family protein [Nocardia niwae]|uniref:DUF6221 family protein n=1 Tax=Nocardia niwae TaxID=626084 RepID=UPI0007A42C52|nr:DUF6221 family protein [Nocardia niwae]
MTIVEFIEARLADWEKLAKSATELPRVTVKYPAKRPPWQPEQWRVDDFGDVVTVNGAANPIQFDPCGGIIRSDHVSALIATFDPAMVLGLVAALRETLALYRRIRMVWTQGDEGPAMRALAALWSEHPEFRQEWAE